MYCVGKFQDRHGVSVEVFPQKWLLEDGHCYWPKKQVTTAIRNQKNPDKTWSVCPIDSILGAYGSFEEAILKVKIAEKQSDLDTEDDDNLEVTRLRRRPQELLTEGPAKNLKMAKSIPQLPKFPTLGLAEGSGTREGRSPNPNSDDEHNREQNIEADESDPGIGNSPESEIIGDPDNDIPFLLMAILNKVKDSKVILDNLAHDMKTVKLTMSNLEKKVDLWEKGDGSSSISTPDPLTSPLHTLELFVEFDSGLIGDKFTNMVTKFKRGGGSSVPDVVGRMMRKLITDDLGTKISLKGMKGNYNFSTTVSINCIKEACLSLTGIGATEQNIERAIGEWLRHAGDRVKSSTKKRINT